MKTLELIGRNTALFAEDLRHYDAELSQVVRENSFLVIGGGGSIGQAVTKQLFARSAKRLHVVDISENYLVELVRDLRSQLGYITKDFDTFAIDCGAPYFEEFMAAGEYDFVLNLSAMKHVRSESSPFSMLRMLEANVFNAISTYRLADALGAKKYFCVSTDKAANPANFMGATKRAMEIALMRDSLKTPVSGARFANVAFSNGSLLQGFQNRLAKRQPLSAPSDIQRFFITAEESGIICLFAAVLGKRNEILFPYNEKEIRLKTFLEIAQSFIKNSGKEAVILNSEEESRNFIETENLDKYWPINVFRSDTVGEKPFEEFYTDKEDLIWDRFKDLASVTFTSSVSENDIIEFKDKVYGVNLKENGAMDTLLYILKEFVPTFNHTKSEKFLNSRM